MMIKIGTYGVAQIKRALIQVMTSETDVIEKALVRDGREILVNDICDAIQSGVDSEGQALKPNKESTIRRKLRRGRGDRPLIDTGQLSSRSNWVVNVRRSGHKVTASVLPTGTRHLGRTPKNKKDIAAYEESHRSKNLSKEQRQSMRKSGARAVNGVFMLRDSTIFFAYLPRKGYDKSQWFSTVAFMAMHDSINKAMSKLIEASMHDSGVM